MSFQCPRTKLAWCLAPPSAGYGQKLTVTYCEYMHFEKKITHTQTSLYCQNVLPFCDELVLRLDMPAFCQLVRDKRLFAWNNGKHF